MARVLGSIAALFAEHAVADTLRIVAVVGQALDSGDGGELSINQIGTATLNELGQAAILALVNLPGGGSSIGIWSEGDSLGLKFVARDGAAAPGAPAGAIFSDMTQAAPAINNLGQVAFRGGLVVGQGGVSSANNSGVWIANPGEPPQLIVREGDQPPNTPAGTQFDAQDEVIQNQFSVFNNAGQVLLRTQLKTGGSITDMNNTGLWIVGINQSVAEIARENLTAVGTGDLWANMVATAHLNDANQAAFVAPLKFLGASTGEGVWFRDPTAGVSLIARTGQTAPAWQRRSKSSAFRRSITWATSRSPVRSRWAARSTLSTTAACGRSGGAGASSCSPAKATTRRACRAGRGLGSAATWTMNNAGRIMFRSVLQVIPGAGSSGISSDNDTAIWAERASGGLELVAREDDQPPGMPAGVEFATFLDPAFNVHDQVAFRGIVRGAGITTANDNGIWAEDTNGVLRLIVKEGDMLDVDDGPGVDLRTVVGPFTWGATGNGDGRRSGFNDNGQLIFSVSFTDGSTGIFVSNLVSASLPGDFNQNGTVDAADYTVWRDTLGLAGAGLAADGNLDNAVDVRDYDLWKFHFGETRIGGGGAVGGRSVPEPGTLLLGLMAACMLMVVLRH